MVVLVFSWLFAISVILAFDVLSGSHVAPVNPPNPPSPAVNAVTVGHDYAVKGLAGTYADALDQAANDMAAGKPMETIEATLQTNWQTARENEGERAMNPILKAIIPEGVDGDSASRTRWAKAAHDLATGIRSVK
jgi:hypothetical protein